MENPEEVLQALDEFKKMRPSEIPRELEEYLSWVAKTGDPVYQWSLVKPLFREKLTRVMTDFYESCPSLELAPCPNVEQFNYDIMKCNLLDLLESFANAPFTVQRICELLTAPRKEYNRVDKFMRAIEKNILVVSTIEPGPAGRRSENGDGMVNGSVDDEAPSTQASHEVEMDSWVKDCTSESSVAIPSTDGETPLFDSVTSGGKTSNVINGEEIPQTRTKIEDSACRTDTDINNAENVPSDVISDTVEPVQNEDQTASKVNVSLESGSETAAMVSEIPVAAMNEDTNSQPSLDSDSETSESPSGRKLQTTFRTKDFIQKEENNASSYNDIPKNETEKIRTEIDHPKAASSTDKMNTDDPPLKSTSDVKLSLERRDADPVADGLPEKRARMDRSIDDLDSIMSAAEDDDPSLKKESLLVDHKVEDAQCISVDRAEKEVLDGETDGKILGTNESSTEELSTCDEEKIGNDEEENETMKEETLNVTDDSLPEAERSIPKTEDPKPIIEEPNFDEDVKKTRDASTSEASETLSGVTIEEAMDDDTKITKSIIPDPIPIIEEPKDCEPTIRDPVITMTITELPEITKNPSDIAEHPVASETTGSTIVVEETTSIEAINEEISCDQESNQEDITDVRCTEETISDKTVEPAESMEVDGDESLANFQQGEPMEQEPGDMVKS